MLKEGRNGCLILKRKESPTIKRKEQQAINSRNDQPDRETTDDLTRERATGQEARIANKGKSDWPRN
jgi:hypothetical protein